MNGQGRGYYTHEKRKYDLKRDSPKIKSQPKNFGLFFG